MKSSGALNTLAFGCMMESPDILPCQSSPCLEVLAQFEEFLSFFASSQFWGDFQNSAELIQLYERPEPPAPVDPEEPVDPGVPEVIFIFEGGVYNWTCDHPTEGGMFGYPTLNSEDPACALNISSGTALWSI